jgi:hypothetical protein
MKVQVESKSFASAHDSGPGEYPPNKVWTAYIPGGEVLCTVQASYMGLAESKVYKKLSSQGRLWDWLCGGSKVTTHPDWEGWMS